MAVNPNDLFWQSEFQFNSGLGRLKRILGDFKVIDAIDIAGRLLLAQLPQGNALSVLVNTTNAAADFAQLAFSADGHVLKRVGNALTTGLVTFANRQEIFRTFTCSGGALSSGGTIGIVANQTVGTWPAIVSNQQEVPEIGWYRIDFSGMHSASAATNPMLAEVELFVGGVSQGVWSSQRFSATSGNVNLISGAPIYVYITTPASELIDIRVKVASGTLDPQDATLRFSIQRVA